MSLLNQVLQDLDQRSPGEPARPVRLAASSDVQPHVDDYAQGLERDWGRIAAWSVVGVAASAALAAALFIKTPQPRTAVAVQAQPLVLPRPAVEPQPAQLAQAAVEPAPAEPPREPVVAPAPQATAAEQRVQRAAPDNDYLALRNTGLPPTTAAVTKPAQRPATPVATASPKRTPSSSVKVAKPVPVQPLDEVRELIADGELATAEGRLLARITSAPRDRVARELLIGLMLRGERSTDALQEIDRGLALFPGHGKFLLIKARLLAQGGETDAAIALLASAGRIEGMQQQRLQMLAALYQQQSRFAAASESYRALIALDARSAAAWAGLAISLDAVGDAGTAEAYRRALALGGLPEPAARYAQQRLAEME